MKVSSALLALVGTFLFTGLSHAEEAACLSIQAAATYGTELLVIKAEMEKDIALCAGSPEFHFNYGYLLERLGKYDKALSQYKTALELDPNPPKYYVGIADILRIKEDRAGAVHYYQMALTKGSTNSRARYNLIKLGGEVQAHAGKAWADTGAKIASLGEPVAIPSRLLSTKARTATLARVMPTELLEEKKLGPARRRYSMIGSPGKSEMALYGAFYMDRKEVSTAQYKQVKPQYTPPPGFSPEMPAVNISFTDAENFAGSVGKRLCTAEEWRLAVHKEAPDLTKMNLYKDYYSTPYSTDFGEEQQKTKNLIGNVAEWVATDKGPGFIGGHYHSATFLQASKEHLENVMSDEGLDGKPYVGMRCCMDAQ